jgi:hypothetical protein
MESFPFAPHVQQADAMKQLSPKPLPPVVPELACLLG